MSDRKVAIVTGGSRGIGRAIVELLAQRGYHVLFSYRSNAEQAAAVCDATADAGAQVRAVKADYPALRAKYGFGEGGLTSPISVKWAGFAELLSKGFAFLPRPTSPRG